LKGRDEPTAYWSLTLGCGFKGQHRGNSENRLGEGMSDALMRIIDRCGRTFPLRAVATIMFRRFQSMMIHLLVGMDAMRSGGFACDFWWLFAPYPILLLVVSCAKKRFGARRAAARSPAREMKQNR
jgi:hypothetical protein